MDGRRRLAQPVKGTEGTTASARRGKVRHSQPATAGTSGRKAELAARFREWIAVSAHKIDFHGHRLAVTISHFKPRYFGATACGLLIAASAAYGAVRGDHVGTLTDTLRDARDAVANAAGFRIEHTTIIGRHQLAESEVLAAAGVTPRTSLLFLDVESARQKLESTPWIAQASVRKLYPGNLEITVQERAAFALWQKNGKLFIISADGTVLTPVNEQAIPMLPLVVGPGAAPKAREFLAILDRYPTIRSELRAAVLVADRRWNLKLKSGLEVRLPDVEMAQALDTLVGLDRDKKILSRDLTAIDLRLPDRITVRLSDEAAQAREQAAKERDKKKKKGGPA